MKLETSEMAAAGDESTSILDDLVCQTLDNGQKIPKLGYWNAISKNPTKDLTEALSSGYRHVVLDNRSEKDDKTIGKAIRSWCTSNKTERQELFITLMLDVSQQRLRSNAQQRVLQRLQELGLEYVNMIVVHKSDTLSTGDNLRQRNAILTLWKSLEKLHSESRTRCLALSDFRQAEMESIIGACQIKPSVIWFTHPPSKLDWNDLDQARRYSQYREMVLGVMPRLDRPETEWVRTTCASLTPVSKKLGRTPLQVYQRFHLQKNILVAAGVDDRAVHSSFKAFDFHIPKEDLDQLAGLSV